ncbi:MAG: hypothetical protein M1820_007014 [Bogoriella megaspora]|nr:MAG: hypothetical protein M1820_007014 [Bogoriella megaspora]
MSMKKQPTTVRPLKVEEIVSRAQQFDYSTLTPMVSWLRTADAMQRQADIYEREGDDQKAYELLFRKADLVLGKLPHHPQAHEHEIALKEARRTVLRNLERLETLKPRLHDRYARYEDDMKRREEKRAAELSKRHTTQIDGIGGIEDMRRLSLGRQGSTTWQDDNSQRSLDAGSNRDLAVKIAKKEIKRRDVARRAVRQAGLSPEEEQGRRTGGLWSKWEDELVTKTARSNSVDDLSQQIIDTRRRIDSPRHIRNSQSVDNTIARPNNFRYPSVQPPTVFELPGDSPIIQELPADPIYPKSPPSIPPYPIELSADSIASKPPPRPPKPPQQRQQLSIDTSRPPPIPSKASFSSDESAPESRSTSTSATPTQIDLSPPSYSFKPSAYLENGTALRTIFLPPELRHSFLSLAAPNTSRNLETCGFLCGTLISNALFISKLVIPEQESTSDTCEMINESALFDYCDREELMVLGWIHTHPTQTCFMSSRDLHTHSAYQVMMPESIAIVCAPSKDPSWGVFRLTDPPGLKTVLNCKQTGIFHPHAEANIYTDALRPGHVFEAKGLDFEIVDLRPGH